MGALGERGKAKTAHGKHDTSSSDRGDSMSTHSIDSDSSSGSDDSLEIYKLEDKIEVMRVTSTIEATTLFALEDTLADYPLVRIWYFPWIRLAELIIGMINAKDNICLCPKCSTLSRTSCRSAS